jgi:UDP-N-acetylmuramoylalanine--D-glutamate ligase
VPEWKNKNITVLGLGRSGISTARYLVDRGARVTLSESQPATESRLKDKADLQEKGVCVELGGHSREAIEQADLIITSPGISPKTDVIQQALAANRDVICDIELAYRETKTPMIAVTGTNGKSTTTALISFILEKAGKKAPACGNFGKPILTEMRPAIDFLVVEISSYQAYYTAQLAPFISIWLNLTPDHIEWHGSIEEYIKAKQKLFQHQSANQFAILNLDDPLVAKTETDAQIIGNSSKSELPEYAHAAFLRGEALVYRALGIEYQICYVDELQIIGRHNIENALAAISACAVAGLRPEEIGLYLKEFKALEHRLEYVATINGVAFYNDSKATNTDSAMKALDSFPKDKVVLIAGGRDKGTSLGDFVFSVRNHASAVILIGEAKERFEKALRDGGVEDIYPVGGLEEAVILGEKLQAGPVLLSPACASFDMFKDFEDRGRVFKDIVRSRL